MTEIHNELQSGETMSNIQRERLKMKLDDKKQELIKLNSDIQELSEKERMKNTLIKFVIAILY